METGWQQQNLWKYLCSCLQNKQKKINHFYVGSFSYSQVAKRTSCLAGSDLPQKGSNVIRTDVTVLSAYITVIVADNVQLEQAFTNTNHSLQVTITAAVLIKLWGELDVVGRQRGRGKGGRGGGELRRGRQITAYVVLHVFCLYVLPVWILTKQCLQCKYIRESVISCISCFMFKSHIAFLMSLIMFQFSVCFL